MPKLQFIPLFLLFTLFSLKGQNKYPKGDFIPPMNIPLILSGTFGELRSNHFHSGIDIKTQGKEGIPIVAVADGEIYRIKVSPYGFGNAIYLKHNNGYSTVYAHLQRFNRKVQDYVRSQQYVKESFSIELYPHGSKFKVKQGDTIAFSGNSGGSGGPHLHFEIRDTRTEKIINPLFFYDIADHKSPELLDLQFYDFQKGELVETKKHKLIKGNDGVYHLAGESVISVNGNPGFAIRTFDRLDKANNKNGVYAIRMHIDGKKQYDFEMETFAFAETRYINSHIDYGQKKCCQRTLNKLFLEPNNRLSVYAEKKKMRLPDLVKDSLHQVRIEVFDISGNRSVLEFGLKQKAKTEGIGKIHQTNLPVFKHWQTNFFKNDYVDLVLPEGALYNDVYFEFEEKAKCSNCYSPIYQLGAEEIPIHKYFNLKIKPTINYTGDKSKLAIASFKNGKILDYEGGKFENGYVVGRTRQLGDFAVVVDTVPPRIRAVNFKNGSNIKANKTLKIKISDNFAGIKSYYPQMDGNWVLMAYDAKKRLLILDLKEESLGVGNHEFKIDVVDELNNKSTQIYKLIL